MSASERLREIHTAMDSVGDNDRDIGADLAMAAFDALPELIAVIEAAEEIASGTALSGVAFSYAHAGHDRLIAECKALMEAPVAALAALDAKLANRVSKLLRLGLVR